MVNSTSFVLIAAGLVRLGDFTSDLAFISSGYFYSDLYLSLCIIFIILPTIPTFFFISFAGLFYYKTDPNIDKLTRLFSIGMICGEQLGLFSLYFGVCSLFWPRADPLPIYMTRQTAIFHSIFESIPSAITQLINCGNLMKYPTVLYISVSLSGLSILFTIFRAVYLLDKITKIERSKELPDIIKNSGRDTNKSNISEDSIQDTKINQ